MNQMEMIEARKVYFFSSWHNLAFRTRYTFCRKESNLSHSLTVGCRRDLYFRNLFDRGSRSVPGYYVGERRCM